MGSQKTFIANSLFRQRALAEAARYGSDAWVFVRELLQNARDAGARKVTFTTSVDGNGERLSCRDDGEGMSLEHAQRFLFALYASSKEERPGDAGKFGIGFWSVLRFGPTTITVRSRSGSDDSWEVVLDGQLEWASVGACDLIDGTEVVLERRRDAEQDSSPDGGRLSDEVFDAARRYGRFLRCRHDAGRSDEPLAVTVDGRAVNAELALPPPCASFGGKGFRGVVGLGRKPRVELFAHGLFVRSADSLQELEEAGARRQGTAAEDALADLPSLAPQVVLDSSELDLLLARSDARQDGHLRRMLCAAEKALGRLITRQLQTLRPQPWYRMWWGVVRDRLDPALAKVAGLVLAFFLALALGSLFLPDLRSSSPEGPQRADAVPAPATAGDERSPAGMRAAAHREASPDGAVERSLLDGQRLRPYSDLSRRYRGPEPGVFASTPAAIRLSYTPADRLVLWNALVIESFDDLRWVAEPIPAGLPPYRGTRCAADCIDVELLVNPTAGALRIPVPTGHRLETSSLRFGGRPVEVFETAAGEAVLRIDGALEGRREPVLAYRTGPAADPGAQRSPRTRGTAIPELSEAASALRELPLPERVQNALRYVAGRVRYDRSPAVTRAYAGAVGGFVSAALAVGAGDCDVQNGVLVELLRQAGVDARLALGYVGTGGRVAAGLHAWAEYLDAGGRWRAADASVFAPAPAPDDLPVSAAGSSTAGPSDASRGPTAGASAGLPVDVVASIVPEPHSDFHPALVAVALVLIAGGAAGIAARRRSAAPTLDLDPGGNLAALLGGALRHPGAFADLPAMAHGRFIPLLGGAGALSLDRARRLAARRRLFRSRLGSPLALEAVDRGVPVVDSATPEGRVASLALGAVDLDHWSELLDRSAEDGLCRRLNRILDRLGEPWRVRAADLGEPLLELALEDLGLGRREVLIDPRHEVFAAVARLSAERPHAAAFSALDLILHRLELDPRDRARLLAAAAHQALREALP